MALRRGERTEIQLSCGNKVLRRKAAVTDLVTIPLYLFPVLIGEHLKSDLVEDIVFFEDMAFQLTADKFPVFNDSLLNSRTGSVLLTI